MPKDIFVPNWHITTTDNVVSVAQSVNFLHNCLSLTDKEKMEKMSGNHLVGEFYRFKLEFFFLKNFVYVCFSAFQQSWRWPRGIMSSG